LFVGVYRQLAPSKTKQNCLELLGFIRPNPDFSAGYAGKSKKIFPFSPRCWPPREDAGSILPVG
jgi:hypothetical protein